MIYLLAAISSWGVALSAIAIVASEYLRHRKSLI
jgi:hypothetical protein